MNGIELPEETSFHLLGLTFTHLWTVGHIYSPLPRLLQGKWGPFIGPSVSLLLNPSCICTNLPFSHVWNTVPIFQGSDEPGKPGKPGNMALFLQNQGNSGKLRENVEYFLKIRENSGKFFLATNFLIF